MRIILYNVITMCYNVSMYDTTITVRTNSNTKSAAQELFSNLGLDMSTAFNMFLKKAVSYRGIPFEVTEEGPNAETLAAMTEVHEHPERGSGPFNTTGELMEYLNAQS